MIRSVILLLICLIMLTSIAISQELVFSNFPIGVGGSVSPELFKSYYSDLKALSDTLHHYPLARAIVTGGADGEQYRNGHDAKNPGLALGRAHVLRNLLVTEFHVDSTQIMIQSKDEKVAGPQNRFASIRIDRTLSDLDARIDTLESRPPVEKHFTEVQEIKTDFIEDFGLQLGAGVSSSPFGAMPVVAGAIVWKRTIYVEAMVGHTFWKNTFRFEGTDLTTRRRMVGASLIVYPFGRMPLAIQGGWVRIEEISQLYYKYVQMSEGPLLGLRLTPLEYLSITASYNPSRHRLAGDIISKSEGDQFLISIKAHKTFGGEK
jgi:hypothetical protein